MYDLLKGLTVVEAAAFIAGPSCGLHLYYAARGHDIRNSAGKLAPLVDVRAADGYVIAPGSRVGDHAYAARDPGPGDVGHGVRGGCPPR